MKTLIHKVILKILKTLRSSFPFLYIKFIIMQQSFVFTSYIAKPNRTSCKCNVISIIEFALISN